MVWIFLECTDIFNGIYGNVQLYEYIKTILLKNE